jgi:hypothetical protein
LVESKAKEEKEVQTAMRRIRPRRMTGPKPKEKFTKRVGKAIREKGKGGIES